MNCSRQQFAAKGIQFAFPCPTCGQTVRQKTLMHTSIQAMDTKKYRDKLSQVRKVRNRDPASFSSLAEFNSYLEETEEIVQRWPDGSVCIDEEDEAEANATRQGKKRTEERNSARLALETLRTRKALFSAQDKRYVAEGDRPDRDIEVSGYGVPYISLGSEVGPSDISLDQPRPVKLRALRKEIGPCSCRCAGGAPLGQVQAEREASLLLGGLSWISL